MALVSKNHTFSPGATILAVEHNENFDTLYNLVNGNIDNANISGSAGIVDSKLAQLSTGGKVAGSALITLGGVPAGSGKLPSANAGVPTGFVGDWPTTSAPTGWLLCDGSAVSRSTYADLFAVISTAFGVGDGSTTFNVPNAKGRTCVAYDSTQTEFDAIAETGGAKTHTLSTAEMPAHTHGLTMRNSNGAGSLVQESADSGGSGAQTTSSTGGGGAHNNLQPYIIIGPKIIKT